MKAPLFRALCVTDGLQHTRSFYIFIILYVELYPPRKRLSIEPCDLGGRFCFPRNKVIFRMNNPHFQYH